MDKNHFVRSAMLAIGLYAGCDVSVLAQSVFREETDGGVTDSLTIDEVVVRSHRLGVSRNSVHTHIDEGTITRAMGRSLAGMLENTSGMSSIQTGTIVSKPVIHGMYGNRILIMAGGARLEGQQWGADHAPELDKNGFSGVAVVKGSESVRYGAEALGGIIVMERQPLPYGASAIHGSVSGMYGSNGRTLGGVAQAQGTLAANRNLAWRVQGTWENGGDRSTARYLLNNTGLRERDLTAMLGYRTGSWQLEAGYGLFWQKIGVMQSAQMGNEQLLQERIALGQPVETTPWSRQIGYPHQQVVHHTAFAKVVWSPARLGQWTWQTTYQADHRRENRIRRMNHSDIPTVSLHLQSVQNALSWQKLWGSWRTEAGLQLLNKKNDNERGTGVVPIIPNYTETSVGAYGIGRYTREQWGAEAGVRGDYQQTQADGYDWTGERYGGTRRFTNFTYSLGGHYEVLPGLTLTTNVGLAWRAPHVYELYSNGNELASGVFVRGDSALRSEQSYKWVTSVAYHSPRIDVRLDGYLQWIDHYIYDQPTHRNIIVISGAYPVFQYMQTSAFFRGVDLDLTVRPLQRWSYRLMGSMVWANERSTGNYLPYIPSGRVNQWLTWEPRVGKCLTARLQASHRFVARQTRFDPSTDLIDVTPAAYHLFGFEAGVTWRRSAGQTLEVNLMGDNVLNRQYKEYTNRARYYAHDMGRNVRCVVRWSF